VALGLEFAAAGSNELGFLKTTMRLVTAINLAATD
jgi:hypothetical protein